jgi:cob(I)yrinic acid a,c-diamide adenosyltransferase
MPGLIHIYTGDGKGKTTAAIGLAVRTAGSGGKVLFSQFLKDGSSSEIKLLNKIDNINCISYKHKIKFIKDMSSEEFDSALKHNACYFDEIREEAVKNNYSLFIMDEFIAAYNFGLIDKAKAMEFLETKPSWLEVVLTGRDAPAKICNIADYISEIKKIKHPFDIGVYARKGIEY